MRWPHFFGQDFICCWQRVKTTIWCMPAGLFGFDLLTFCFCILAPCSICRLWFYLCGHSKCGSIYALDLTYLHSNDLFTCCKLLYLSTCELRLYTFVAYFLNQWYAQCFVLQHTGISHLIFNILYLLLRKILPCQECAQITWSIAGSKAKLCHMQW